MNEIIITATMLSFLVVINVFVIFYGMKNNKVREEKYQKTIDKVIENNCKWIEEYSKLIEELKQFKDNIDNMS